MPPGIALYGHLSEPIGLGSSARGLAASLDASGLPAIVHDIPMPRPRAVRHPLLPTPAAGGMAIGLIVTNPDLVLRSIVEGALAGPQSIERTYMIGFWAWESHAGIPDSWRPAIPLFDEVWTPSSFTAAAIAPHVPYPVVTMGLPAAAWTEATTVDHQALGIAAGAFTFLFTFDPRSSVARKNPAAVIRAFRGAFPEARPHIQLVLKTRNLTPHDRHLLDALRAGREDIRVVDRSLTADEMQALMTACDCYVSLHRAEGFGLTMAEAMAAGRPVIATAFSGNLDFMTHETACLVDYRTVTLDRPSPPFPAGTVWAEASIPQAVRLMRAVHERRGDIGGLGARAARYVAQHLTPDVIGARMRARVEMLRDTGRLRPADLPQAPAVVVSTTDATVPSVLIATPMKNAVRFLDRYFALLGRLDHEPSRLSLAVLEGDSTDGTWQALQDRAADLRRRFGRVTLLQRHFDYQLAGARHRISVQRRRRSILARSRNRLLAGGLRQEDWVLWLDVDVSDYPADLIARLIAAGRDIVVPHCVSPSGKTYDLNSFVLESGPNGPNPEDRRHLIDGLFQPPVGAGRKYLRDFRGQALVEMHGVGGTALLIRADLHREGLIFPAGPYRGYIETEGLAFLARDMGHRCWGIPDLEIRHPPY